MNVDPISRRSIARTKRPAAAVSTAKRLRSKIQRWQRVPLLPIAAGISNSDFDVELEEESSSSCLHSKVSFDSSLGFGGSEVMKRPRSSRAAKSKKPVAEQRSGDEFRRITRSYAKRYEMLRSDEKAKEESGGVGFLSRSRDGGAAAKGSEPEISEGNAVSEIQISEVTQITAEFLAGNLEENAVSSEAIEKFQEISEPSCLESISDVKSTKICSSVADQGSSLQIAGDLAVLNESPSDVDLDSDLSCSEQLSDADDGCSEYSTCKEMPMLEADSELFYSSSDRRYSNYSLSVLFESPEDFSERSSESGSESSTPSVVFSLLVQLTKQFKKSSTGPDLKVKSGVVQIDSSQEFTVMRFEEEEESYKNIRSRERREVFLHNFNEEYSAMTDCGKLILRQRLLMVNWMVEHSQVMELQHETLFLGVSLMDRFLSKGYFESERNLQLLGIASVTLATRLEEVQPGNSIWRRTFTVVSNVYTRREIVAMEWLLLEVLNFQCMNPTTHNFLWFYLKAAKADAEVESLVRYLAVLSLLDHNRLSFWPSTVAAGLVILACLATNRDASSLRVMEMHVRSKSDDLPECIQSLEWLVKYAS